MPVVAADRPRSRSPLAIKPIRAMETRTDGPALNKALAATGGLLAVYSLLVTIGLLISVVRWTLRGRSHPLRAPVQGAVRDGARALTRREMVLLRIRDEDGVEGLGEAVPLSLRGGVTIETVVRELEAIGPDCRAAADGLSLPARCALTTALLDLEEKAGATTSERHAGAVQRDAGQRARPTDGRRRRGTVGDGRVRDVQAEGRRRRGRRRRCEAVRAALGAEAKIRLDANASWSLEEATEILDGGRAAGDRAGRAAGRDDRRSGRAGAADRGSRWRATRASSRSRTRRSRCARAASRSPG